MLRSLSAVATEPGASRTPDDTVGAGAGVVAGSCRSADVRGCATTRPGICRGDVAARYCSKLIPVLAVSDEIALGWVVTMVG